MSLRILITGVNGFVGRKLARALQTEGHGVFGVSLESHATGLEGKIEYRQLDITDQHAVSALFASTTFDALIHLAALVHVRDAQLTFVDYSRVNFRASETLFRTAVAHRVSRVILASTVEVYGPVPDHGRIGESHPCRPDSEYARSKLLAEQTLQQICLEHRTANVIFRFAPVYSSEFRLNLDKRLYLRAPWLGYRLGDGKYQLNLCSIRNIEACVSRWLGVLDSPSGVFNLADERAWSVNEILSFERLNGRARIVVPLPKTPSVAALAIREVAMAMAGVDAGMYTIANLRKLSRSSVWDTSRARMAFGSLPGDLARDLYGSASPQGGKLR